MVSSIPTEYNQFFSRSISPIDETLIGITSPYQSEPGSNDNKGVPKSSRTGASQLDAV